MQRRKTDERLTRKHLVGNSRGLFEALSWHLREENHEEPHSEYSVSSLKFEPRTSRIQAKRIHLDQPAWFN
jgi:hypothetical protein